MLAYEDLIQDVRKRQGSNSESRNSILSPNWTETGEACCPAFAKTCETLRHPIQTCAKVHGLGITIPDSRCISLQVLIRNPNNREQIMVLDDVHATARNFSRLIPAYTHQNPNSRSHTTLDRFPPSSNSKQRATSLQDKFLLLHSAQKTLRHATDYAFPHSI